MMSDWLRQVRSRIGTMLIEVPSVAVVVRDDAGRVLVVQDANRGLWVFPGGAVDPEETPADAAVREVYEEAGVEAELTDLIGVFGGPDFVVEYANGDRTSYMSAVFAGVVRAGTPRPDDTETVGAEFVTREALSGLPQARWMPEVVAAAFAPPRTRLFRPPTWRP